MIINVATIHAEENGEPINETPAANQEELEEPADDDGGREPAPKTADGSSLYLWYALASASSLSVVLISRNKKH